MPLTLEPLETAALVRLEGEINIASAAELKEQMLGALELGKPLRIDLSAATSIDITTMQLLLALAREAAKRELSCTLCAQPQDAVTAAFTEAGFEQLPLPLELDNPGEVLA